MAHTVIRLKRATWKLRAEALRRYRQRHLGSLDRAEQEIEQLFENSRQVAPAIPVNNVAENSQHHEETALQVPGVQGANVKSSIAEGVWVAAKSHVDFGIEATKQPTKETDGKSAASKKSAKPNFLTKSRTNAWENDNVDNNEMASLRVRGSSVIRQGRKGTGKEMRIPNYDSRSAKAIINTGYKSKLGTREDKGQRKNMVEVESAYDENESVFDDQVNFEDASIDDGFKHPSAHICASHRNASFAISKKKFAEDFDRQQDPSHEFIDEIYQLPVQQSVTAGSTANDESGFIKRQQEHASATRFNFEEENMRNMQGGVRHTTPVDQFASPRNNPVEIKDKMSLSSSERRHAEDARVSSSSAGSHRAEAEGKLQPSAVKSGYVTNRAQENKHNNEVTRRSLATDVENKKYNIDEKREVRLSMEQDNVSRTSSHQSGGKNSRLSNDSKFGDGLHSRHHRHGSRSIDLTSSSRHFASSLTSSVDLPTANDQDMNSSLESGENVCVSEHMICRLPTFLPMMKMSGATDFQL